jgi:hypothetical protein
VSAVELPSPRMTLVDHGIEAGIQWVTCQAPLYGAVNGYVKIPAGHHWHGLDYDDIGVDVHGGLTYGSENGWVGFDCLHCGDVWPDGPDYERGKPYSRNWTPELVAQETRRLARNIAAAAYTVADLSGACFQAGDDG